MYCAWGKCPTLVMACLQQWLRFRAAVPKFLSPDNCTIAEGLGGPFNDFSVCCLTVVMRRATYAKDANKEAGIAFNLSHEQG
jgi:hypothetical protein